MQSRFDIYVNVILLFQIANKCYMEYFNIYIIKIFNSGMDGRSVSYISWEVDILTISINVHAMEIVWQSPSEYTYKKHNTNETMSIIFQLHKIYKEKSSCHGFTISTSLKLYHKEEFNTKR